MSTCPICNGTGNKPLGRESNVCQRCHGLGRVNVGLFATEYETCPDCGGDGERHAGLLGIFTDLLLGRDKCPMCDGSGRL